MQIVSASWSDRLSWGAQARGWGYVSEPSVPGGLVPSRASSPDAPPQPILPSWSSLALEWEAGQLRPPSLFPPLPQALSSGTVGA